ncbi:MAG: anion transporter [Acidobacteriota bacterium]|nr:anion transporter [Acidobacteriota bacterium]
MAAGSAAPALIFLLTYLVVAVGRLPFLRVDRTGAAVIGAILMVVAGGLGLDAAYRTIDYRTLGLLFGMMVLVAHLRLSGAFAWLAEWIVQRVRRPLALLAVIVAVAGTLSALFVNDTICLVFTPVVLDLAEARGLSPLPLLVGLATGANIGSVATVTGNPQNMLIGSLSRMTYLGFLGHLAPVAVVGLGLDVLVIGLVFRQELARGGRTATLPAPPVHRGLMIKALVVAAGVLAGFLAGYDTAVVALAGAAVLLVTRRVNPRKVYQEIDWDLLMLFIGLFVVIGGVEHAGLDQVFFTLLQPIGVATVGGLTVAAAVLSNLVSNVPAVMLFTRLVPRLPDPGTAWLTLAMASTLAGNLTIVGSIANLIVVEGAARRRVRLSFWQYLKVGVPLTLCTLLVGILWLGR